MFCISFNPRKFEDSQESFSLRPSNLNSARGIYSNSLYFIITLIQAQKNSVGISYAVSIAQWADELVTDLISVSNRQCSNLHRHIANYSHRIQNRNSSYMRLFYTYICQYYSIHKNLSFLSPIRVLAAFPIVFKTFKKAALKSIRRFTTA